MDSDPLCFAHRYTETSDREAVAILAALTAYGNVKQIKGSVQSVLDRIEADFDSPSVFLEAVGRGEVPKSIFSKIVHRFNVGHDYWILSQLIAQSHKEFGSVGKHFGSFVDSDADTIEQPLSRLVQDWKKRARALRAKDSFYFFLNDPQDGSNCKRWCMLLRWMIRNDGVDLGLWSEFAKPSQLVIPLDTHVGRICQDLGLTRRKTLGWKAAIEITERLREIDPDDPVKFDFSLARIGIIEKKKRIDYSELKS